MKINDRTIKNIFPTLLTFIFSLSILVAQNDTMYVMKDGVIVDKYNINTEIDSLIFYHPYIQTDSSFTDFRDGNVYKTVTIGSQLWMAENLKYLPEVIGPATGSDTISYYYVYGYDGTNVTDAKATSNYDTYGVLYNWTAAMDSTASSSADPSGVQGVCPTGWHLPSEAEWTALEDYLIANGYNWDGSTSGDKTGKSLAATSGWNSSSTTGDVGNDQQSNNSTGFTALPGGCRDNDGTFDITGQGGIIGYGGDWWSATEYSATNVFNRGLRSSYDDLYRDISNKDYGLSVRCVRD
jgi:uncharacterized protein (TIGR02145 family)